MMKYEFFECSCGMHALSVLPPVGKWYGFELAVWGRAPTSGPFSWRERLRMIWTILRKGHPCGDWVVLHPAEALRLAEYLIEQVKGSNPGLLEADNA